MTPEQLEWSRTRDELVSVIKDLGFPEELGSEIAKILGSPKAMRRMISYLYYVKPNKADILVDDCVIISPSQKSLENTGAWQKCTDFRPKNTVTKCLAGIFEKAALLFLKPNTLIQSLYFRKPVPAF